MARQRPGQGSPPTIPADRAIPILEKLVLDSDALRSQAAYSPQRQQWLHTSEGALLQALGSDHPALAAFSLAQTGVSNLNDSEQVRQRRANLQLDDMLAAMRSAVDQLRWTIPDPTQVFLPAGSTHDAYVEIRKIVAQATTEILIVDSYVDHSLWPLLTNVPSAVKIRIVTGQMKGDFALEGRKFVAQHGATVEVRTTPSYHDRFILIDASKCWHLGASIKDAGNKAFAMSEIIRATIEAAILADVESVWKGATIVTL